MKLTIPASELSTAVKEYLQRTYSLYGEVTVQELHEVEVDIHPRTIESLYSPSVIKEQEEVNTVDKDREDAINRADHLGIKYRADISTEKLIERIEDKEEEMSHPNYLASWETEEDGYAVSTPYDGNELPLEDDVDTVVESDEPLEEEASDETIEAEEIQPEKKKKSIFAKD